MDERYNKILHTDLSTKQTSVRDVTRKLRMSYIGGAGINTKLLFDSVGPETDALSPENILIFGAGVLVGTGFLSGARLTISSKSPLTGIFGDSNAGGSFGAKMRSAGYDHILLTGKSETPVYLLLSSDSLPRICDASHLWGKGTDETNKMLRDERGECDVACIGPAGENLVRFAAVIVSRTRAAGRTGMGCIMGAKKLKAIVIKGRFGIPVEENGALMELHKRYLARMKKSASAIMYSKYGTLHLLDNYNTRCWLPNYNGQQMQSKKVENISVDVFNDAFQTGRTGCYSCPIACTKRYRISEGRFRGTEGEKIDFGSVASLGPNLGIYDYPTIIHLHHIAHTQGLDTIETGATISMAMECYQRGIITRNDTEGISLQWGNGELIEQLLFDIANRRGFGAVLAEGAKRAGEMIGGERYAFNVKGMSSGTHSRNRNDWALGYGVSTRGGDHLKAFPFSTMYGPLSKQFARKLFKSPAAIKPGNVLDTGRVVWWHENYKVVVDSLGLCIFAISGLAIMGNPLYDDLAELFSCATKIPITGREMMIAAERICQLQKAFNVRHGIIRENDYLPRRLPEPDLPDALSMESIVDFDHEGMLDEYYKFRGYSHEGFPTVKRLREVDLESVIPDLGDRVTDCDVFSISDLFKECAINL